MPTVNPQTQEDWQFSHQGGWDQFQPHWKPERDTAALENKWMKMLIPTPNPPSNTLEFQFKNPM